MSDSPGKRLALFRKSLGLSQRDFAASCDVSGGLIGQIEAGRTPPSRTFLQKISDRYRISADWLLYGTGEMIRAPSPVARKATVELPDTTMPAHGDVRLDGVDFQLIKRFDVEAGAGPGRLVLSDEPKDRVAFTRSWLLRLGVNADLAGLVRVRGDSMAPNIRDGALVLVHFAEMEVDNGRVYAFTYNDELFVKRLTKVENGWLITSDNPDHQPTTIEGRAAQDLMVSGRVRAVISEL